MSYLPDHLVDRLSQAAGRPDFSGTRYEVIEEIGQGGMGVVYRGRDRLLGREVALKVIEAAAEAVPESEAALLARLEHPGIVPVYDAGELPDGRRYHAMRLVNGLRLDGFIPREPSLPARLRVFLRVCDAVAFAHGQGVIHRDLKPQNIMTGDFGQVFVLDWGVAHRAHDPDDARAGTPRFMPPEAASASRERYDIYSLGRVLAEVAGTGAPAPLLGIAAKASAPDPAARYTSVGELAADVARYLDRLPVSAYRESPWERLARFAARNQALLLLVTAYLVVKFALFFMAR